jgi:AcrR family transcriptional regulator
MILQAATRLFAVKGFRDTSMVEISRVTGVASGTIFYHFKSKEALFLAILADVRETITTDFERFFNRQRFATGLEMIEGAVWFYLQLAGDREDLFLLLHRHYPYELAEVNPVCKEHLEAIHICLTDIFETAIRNGQTDRSIAKMSARKTALIVYSLVDGIVRFNTYKLYHAGALYNELIAALHRMLRSQSGQAGIED